MNPYLAFSAILGLGLHGIREKLELKSPPVNSENYKSFKRLPKTLKEATDCMAREGSLARKVLGDGFVDHYAGTRVRRIGFPFFRDLSSSKRGMPFFGFRPSLLGLGR